MKNNLKKILKEKGLSQKDLAKKTNITRAAISRYVRGERIPNGYNLLKMAKTLSLKAEDIFTLED